MNSSHEWTFYVLTLIGLLALIALCRDEGLKDNVRNDYRVVKNLFVRLCKRFSNNS